MEKWQKRLTLGQPDIKELGQGVTDKGGIEATALAQAQEVARRTRELLVVQGWCLWKCTTLGGDIIAVVRDEDVQGVPGAYPVYTELELEELCQNDVSEASIRLVHEGKKLAGAKIVPEGKKKEFNYGKSFRDEQACKKTD